MQRQRIAIVGGGIAGMGCAWFLHRKFDVTLFENEDRIGGHSHTITVDDGDGEQARLDTGFHGLLTRLFEALDVPTEAPTTRLTIAWEILAGSILSAILGVVIPRRAGAKAGIPPNEERASEV